MNTETTLVSTEELWQVQSADQIYDVHFDELAELISAGSLLRIDRVRKANLRWIEAGKVSALADFFNAKDESDAIAPTVTVTDAAAETPAPTQSIPAVIVRPSPRSKAVCSVHQDAPAAFVCDTCNNMFC